MQKPFLPGLWCVVQHNQVEEKNTNKLIGTPIYGVRLTATGEPGETTILRAGIFDDIEILNKQKPVAELYTDARVKWVHPLEDADQFTGMIPLP